MTAPIIRLHGSTNAPTLAPRIDKGDEQMVGKRETIQTLGAEWVAGRVARGEIGTNSAQVQLTRLRSLVKVYGERPVDDLDRQALLAWQASIGRKAPASRKAYLCTVKQFCAWLAADGRLGYDPAADLARPRLPKQKPRSLSAADVNATLAACKDRRERLIVWLEVGCGLRAKEVSGLDLEDYDVSDRTLFVRGKFGNERLVPIPPEVAPAIDEWLAERGWRPGPLVLAVGSRSSPDGRLSPHWLSTLVARRMATAGVHRAPLDRRTGHALRHTCARDVLDNCEDLTIVQEILGHRSLATTGMYLGITNLGRIREAMSGRSYRGRSPTVIRGAGDQLRGAPSSGTHIPDAGSPTGPADPYPATA